MYYIYDIYIYYKKKKQMFQTTSQYKCYEMMAFPWDFPMPATPSLIMNQFLRTMRTSSGADHSR
jgi:hypothetical protein